jgi:hypothetical protein
MESQRFDTLTRGVATGTARRRLLHAAAAVGVGGLLTRLGAGAAVAATRCQSLGRKCDNRRVCNCYDPNAVCATLNSRCNATGNRCCGTSRASCTRNCDCCAGFRCNKTRGVCKVA